VVGKAHPTIIKNDPAQWVIKLLEEIWIGCWVLDHLLRLHYAIIPFGIFFSLLAAFWISFSFFSFSVAFLFFRHNFSSSLLFRILGYTQSNFSLIPENDHFSYSREMQIGSED
jgi:hypothetical protein